MEAARQTVPAEAVEHDRVLRVYAGRGRGDYGFTDLWNLRIFQQRQRLLAEKLRRARLTDLAALRVLDVGCGEGRQLRTFNQWGVPPTQLHGCDINPGRIEIARSLHPAIDLRVNDPGPLPYADDAFDLVCQSTVFTSILCEETKASLAGEMLRVCRPGGAVVWFDFRYDNPSNKNVRGVGLAEVRKLFRRCVIDATSVGLLPPLARRLVGGATPLAWLLERLPPLRYAHLALITKPN